MSNATIALPQVCHPYLSSAARTLAALLLMGAVSSAGAADIDTYKIDAFAQSATTTNCTTTNLSDPL